eukprot:jgi/Astpho2/3663/e_gw1.00059.37.1_t
MLRPRCLSQQLHRHGWLSAPQAKQLQTCNASSSQNHPSLLFISSVWPERSSSAAGVRTWDLVTAFMQAGCSCHYVSSSAPNEHTRLLDETGCSTSVCPPNREQQLTAILEQAPPDICIFDRFYTEEAFSFRVREVAPEALRVLDMQDCHFLRKGRCDAWVPRPRHGPVLAHRPPASDLNLQRELASIHRCDLTLVCSPVEHQLLQQHYGAPAHKLCSAPFFVQPAQCAAPGWEQRQHFMAIGNFRHAPNMDSVRWLSSDIWESLRKQVPQGTELHVFGAYVSGAAQQLHDPASGFHIRGHAPSLDIMHKYKACLAPLRFGAGLKGKIVDAWQHGLPVCTTPIGAEGMMIEADESPQGTTGVSWGGSRCATDSTNFAAEAARLYNTKDLWNTCQQQGYTLLQRLYDADANLAVVKEAIFAKQERRDWWRAQDFTGQMLWSQQLRATEFFSRWIELKESRPPN